MASHGLVKVDRRGFTLEAALALLSGVVITISGCGTSGSESPTGVAPTPEPTPTPVSGPTPDPGRGVGPAPTPKPTSRPGHAPAPSSSPSPSPTPSPTPGPTPTPSPSPSPTPISDVFGVISENHGHIAHITAAQLIAGGAIALDIQGTATHTHAVVLSSGDVMDIANGREVSSLSTTTLAHDHLVTFN